MKTMKKSATKALAKKPATKACAKKTCATRVKKPALVPVLFTCHANPGSRVALAGCFNGWDPEALEMKDAKANGLYKATVKLAPGTYQYKFVVDGVWQIDPENADFVANDMGSLNSIVVVK